jgi:hypothetical protein
LDEIKPSIEIAAKIADVLESSLDYLVRGINQEEEMATLPAHLVQQFSKSEKLSPLHKDHVMAVIDAFEAKEKLQSQK